MVYAFLILTLIAVGSVGAVILARRSLVEARNQAALAKAESERLLEKYKDVIDLESFCDGLELKISDLQAQITADESLNDSLKRQATEIKQQLQIFEEDQTVIDCGLYTPVYVSAGRTSIDVG
jgi:peptidoglycan hydrolase CwlO-like protein